MKILKSILFILKNNILLDDFEKKFIRFNKEKYSNRQSNSKISKKNIILIDLFHWQPWIIIWSILVNFLSKKLNCEAKFFYIDLYQRRSSKYPFFLTKIKKLFSSFNVNEGINEYKFKYSKEEIYTYQSLFKNIKSKEDLVNFKYKSYDIGLLVYDTYVRIGNFPTINLQDKKLETIFIRGIKTLEEFLNFFEKYNVKCVIPSHLCYISYGIVARIALKKNIPIVKIYSKFRGNSSYRIHRIKDILVDEAPYFKFKNEFELFSDLEKEKYRKIGQKLINKRLSGEYDNNLPYMKLNQFNKKLESSDLLNNKKKKIFLFPHCYFDNPHKYRWMIFTDFYEQVKFLLNLSKETNDEYQWYYKPHPNELNKDLDLHTNLLKEYPNVCYLNKNVGHSHIISSKPDLIISNHGKVCHEYAYNNIPVINTGDNAHVNYNFSLNPKNKTELRNMVLNINRFKHKIDFDKDQLHEYLYMDFYHYNNKYGKNENFNERFFSSEDININNSSKVYKYFLENFNEEKEKKINTYLELFYKDNFSTN